MGSVILGYARTPFGRFDGALAHLEPHRLGAAAIASAIERAGVAPDEVDEVVFGNVVAAGAGQIPSRQAALAAGVPVEVPTETVNTMCASGMRAVALADRLIRSGDRRLVVAGGMENMSWAPSLVSRTDDGFLPAGGQVAAFLRDGLVDSWDGSPMTKFGMRVAGEAGISRMEQDQWALRSHERAVAGRDSALAREIVPIGPLTHDEGPRPDTSLARLTGLAAIDADGTVTAGNAPFNADGAAALVLCDEAVAAARDLPWLARVAATAQVAGPRPCLGTLPAIAGHAALAEAEVTPGELAQVEVNEAFASVAISVVRRLGVDPARVNLNGGAIALGHPIGATGARITGTLARRLHEQGGVGLATTCSAGAQGDAVVLQAPA